MTIGTDVRRVLAAPRSLPRRKLRVLFVSAFYPPHEIGGWEQLTHDIRLGLQRLGHDTAVLCSNHGITTTQGTEPGVFRWLQLDNDLERYRLSIFLRQRASRDRQNLWSLQQAVGKFAPDVIFIHGMWNLSRKIPWWAEQLWPDRVVYYVADEWPYSPPTDERYWGASAQSSWPSIPKRAVGWLVLRSLASQRHRQALHFERVLCVSEAIKTNMVVKLGLPIDSLQVVYNGIDVQTFAPKEKPEAMEATARLSLAYAGNLGLHKGVHTVIEAMDIMNRAGTLGESSLSIIGSGHHEYAAYLKGLVDQYDLIDRVSFLGRLPREDMPEILRRFDVLVSPSTGMEGLPRTVQEAMASGLVVVGTITGGSKELLAEGETGLTFHPGDAANLACQLTRLMADAELRHRLAVNGRKAVADRFNIERTVAEIEYYFMQKVSQTHENSQHLHLCG